mgnify:FL=1
MLKNGNPSGDPSTWRKCGAKRHRRGGTCQAPAMKGKKRCRMHGGLSTGPRTPEGLARSRRANWKHGRFSWEAIEARRQANWETWEQAKARLHRQLRREGRQASRDLPQFRRTMQALGL